MQCDLINLDLSSFTVALETVKGPIFSLLVNIFKTCLHTGVWDHKWGKVSLLFTA